MSICTYTGIHSSKLKYPLQMSRAAHCLPRHQTWAGYTTRTDVHKHLHTALPYMLLFDLDVSGNQSQSTYFLELTDLSDTFSLLINTYQCY